MVTAKFKCTEKRETENGFEIHMEPVTSGSAENEFFYKYTPYGQFHMGTVNKEAAAYFEVGKEYYLNF